MTLKEGNRGIRQGATEQHWPRGLLRLTQGEFVLRREGIVIHPQPFFTFEGQQDSSTSQVVDAILEHFVAQFGIEELQNPAIFARYINHPGGKFFPSRRIRFQDPANQHQIVNFNPITINRAELTGMTLEHFMNLQISKLLKASRRNIITLTGFHAAFPKDT